MKTERFVRKPFPIDAVRVTAENMTEVAKWCDGEVKYEPTSKDDGAWFISVKVVNPINSRQTQAFIGDWVLYSKGWKVYFDGAFRNNFDPMPEEDLEMIAAVAIVKADLGGSVIEENMRVFQEHAEHDMRDPYWDEKGKQAQSPG